MSRRRSVRWARTTSNASMYAQLEHQYNLLQQKYTTTLEERDGTIAALQRECKHLSNKNDQLEESIQQLNKKIDSYEEQIATYQQLLAQHALRVNEVEGKLAQVNSLLEDHEAGAYIAESRGYLTRAVLRAYKKKVTSSEIVTWVDLMDAYEADPSVADCLDTIIESMGYSEDEWNALHDAAKLRNNLSHPRVNDEGLCSLIRELSPMSSPELETALEKLVRYVPKKAQLAARRFRK
eukprot:TRINITY_DN1726_c0_g1_i3.p1 TRINITY_DN1726_c0_g1~~TRINITY_DN1726_c0_g1_i3.p1  ORF type:complete len:237 (+),score=40.53 TRINITY_DN1726_c0_g1_i3:91-801(+)